MAEREEFKTTWKGGYDKDDVLQGLEDLRGDIYEEQHRLQDRIEELDRDIAGKRTALADLEAKIARCDEELADLQSNVRENYQTYIDSYDAIGSQIYESRVYADRVQKTAQDEKAQLLAEALDDAKAARDEALADASRIREEARAEAEKQVEDARLASGRQADIGRLKYEAVQRELHAILGDFSRLQRKFMVAYKSINDVLNDESGDLARLRLEEPDEGAPAAGPVREEESSAKQETVPEDLAAVGPAAEEGADGSASGAASADGPAPGEDTEKVTEHTDAAGSAAEEAPEAGAATIRLPDLSDEKKAAGEAERWSREEASKFDEAVESWPTRDLKDVREALADAENAAAKGADGGEA